MREREELHRAVAFHHQVEAVLLHVQQDRPEDAHALWFNIQALAGARYP